MPSSINFGCREHARVRHPHRYSCVLDAPIIGTHDQYHAVIQFYLRFTWNYSKCKKRLSEPRDWELRNYCVNIAFILSFILSYFHISFKINSSVWKNVRGACVWNILQRQRTRIPCGERWAINIGTHRFGLQWFLYLIFSYNLVSINLKLRSFDVSKICNGQKFGCLHFFATHRDYRRYSQIYVCQCTGRRFVDSTDFATRSLFQWMKWYS